MAPEGQLAMHDGFRQCSQMRGKKNMKLFSYSKRICSLASSRSFSITGSDWPVSTPDPLQAIHTAVTRTAYDDPGRAGTEAFLPEQALPLEAAFAAYTSGSARLNGSRAGVVAPGAPADVVLLDRDPFAGPAEEIGATRVRATWARGSLVAEPSGL